MIHVWAPWGRDVCHLRRYINRRTLPLHLHLPLGYFLNVYICNTFVQYYTKQHALNLRVIYDTYLSLSVFIFIHDINWKKTKKWNWRAWRVAVEQTKCESYIAICCCSFTVNLHNDSRTDYNWSVPIHDEVSKNQMTNITFAVYKASVLLSKRYCDITIFKVEAVPIFNFRNLPFSSRDLRHRMLLPPHAKIWPKLRNPVTSYRQNIVCQWRMYAILNFENFHCD